MKILFAGGGTMGSVSPLIAVYQKIKKREPETEFLFIGTDAGPERRAVESYRVNFKSISSGKWRRYFSWANLFDPLKIIIGFFQAFFIILKYKPNVVMVAGSYVGVPVAYAANFLRVPLLIHQQDILAGLANRLMANVANKITVSFEPSLKDFYRGKTILTGNPVREEIYSCQVASSRELLQLKSDLPVLLILGGGTGSLVINDLIQSGLSDLMQFCQIIHVTGAGKRVEAEADNYHQFEFLTNEMQDALCASNLVVSRAGLSTLSELIILAKPTVLIPLPGHQEFNAQYFQKNNAALVLSQSSLTKEMFVDLIKELLGNEAELENLSRNIAKMMNHDGANQVATVLLEMAK
jgi:UDP-N-acetylglucosamine--N-acetylmuramyl-(pentapeptide) pyrophosphoryl-undecaprenol N-acetylglucosamine transferase